MLREPIDNECYSAVDDCTWVQSDRSIIVSRVHPKGFELTFGSVAWAASTLRDITLQGTGKRKGFLGVAL